MCSKVKKYSAYAASAILALSVTVPYDKSFNVSISIKDPSTNFVLYGIAVIE